VDFVESNSANIPLLSKLLTSGSGPFATDSMPADRVLTPPANPIIVPAPGGPSDNGSSEGSGSSGGDKK